MELCLYGGFEERAGRTESVAKDRCGFLGWKELDNKISCLVMCCTSRLSCWKAAHYQTFSTWESQWSCAHFCILCIIIGKDLWEGRGRGSRCCQTLVIVKVWTFCLSEKASNMTANGTSRSLTLVSKWWMSLRQCPISRWFLMRNWMPWRSRYPRSRMTSSVKR